MTPKSRCCLPYPTGRLGWLRWAPSRAAGPGKRPPAWPHPGGPWGLPRQPVSIRCAIGHERVLGASQGCPPVSRADGEERWGPPKLSSADRQADGAAPPRGTRVLLVGEDPHWLPRLAGGAWTPARARPGWPREHLEAERASELASESSAPGPQGPSGSHSSCTRASGDGGGGAVCRSEETAPPAPLLGSDMLPSLRVSTENWVPKATPEHPKTFCQT